YGPNFRHPVTGRSYADYTDTASQVDYKIFREWTRNFDGGSAFFYVPRGGKLTMGPLWDYNWALGNVNYAEGGDLPGYRTDGWNRSFTANVNGWSPWWLRFEQDPEWQQQLIDRWHALRQGPLADEHVQALIAEMASLLEQEAAGRNFQKWPVLGQFTVISPPGYQNRTTYRSEVAYLEDWILERMAWIDSQFLEAPSLAVAPGDDSLEVTLSSPDGAVYYTTDGADPRASGGAPSPSATQFAGGRIDVLLVPETAASRFLVPVSDSIGDAWLDPNFDDSGWTPGLGGLGFETPGGPLLPAITTDVSGAMLGINASLYVRFTFDYEHDPSLLHRLTLLLRYDDAFVAWINGSESARDAERSPAQIAWDSVALGSRPDSEGVQFEEFDLTPHADQLRRGRNVLAIQIMNTSAGSSDLLLHPVLTANQTVGVQPLRLEQSTRLIARTRSGDAWSAPFSAYLPIGENPPSAANLLVSEIMYHPADPSPEERAAGFDDAELFEFLELHNPSARPVSVGEVRFSNGIRFDFLRSSTPSIPPGGYLVVVSDPEAFAARYGASRPIAGSYEGNLRNSGETLTIEASGITLMTIDFSDAWFPATDGEGYSLVLRDRHAPPSDWSTATAWRQSGLLHGSPGWAEDSGGYSDWLVQHFSPAERDDPALTGPAADPDGDGGANFVEYALGLDPRTPDPASLPTLHFSTGNGLRLAELVFERPLDRTDIRFELQSSADLRTWAVDAGAVFQVTAAGAGFERVRVRPSEHPEKTAILFLRLRVAGL
ncbi:MAG TPA: CotH kinase family protein, partial [Verrucomicrobiales bacterium]|nr:CotH kinase family protein [Verrucomicrobiales bacterium]